MIDASENSEVKMFLQKSLKKDPNARNEMNGSSDDTDSIKVIMFTAICSSISKVHGKEW